MELSCLLVGETSRLGVVLMEGDGSDSPISAFIIVSSITVQLDKLHLFLFT